MNTNEATEATASPAEVTSSAADTESTSALSAEWERIFKALREPFSSSQISWRVGACNKDMTRGQALPYIDARAVQNRLDRVVGPHRWKNEFAQVTDGVLCRLSIKVGDEWVSKEDVASYNASGDPDFKVKGAHSDAFKRAAVMWGIGRYLYAFEAPWVKLDNGRLAEKPQLPPHMLPEKERKAAAERAARKGTRQANVTSAQPAQASQPSQAQSKPASQKPAESESARSTETPSASAAARSEPATPTAEQSATSEATLSAPPIGTPEQWASLEKKMQRTAVVLVERIAKGFALEQVEEYLTRGAGANLPEWLRNALIERVKARLAEKQKRQAAAA